MTSKLLLFIKMVVINSSPLIALGKIGKLELVHKIFDKVAITEQVYEEILSKPSYEGAIAVKRAVEDGKWLKVEESPGISELIGAGEASSIGLAIKLKQPLIIDDRKAAFIASTFGVECHGTLYIILEALKGRTIRNKKEAIDVVNQLVNSNLYLSSEILTEFYSLLDKIKIQ